MKAKATKSFLYIFTIPIIGTLFFIIAPKLEQNFVERIWMESIKKSNISEEIKRNNLEYIRRLNFSDICHSIAKRDQELITEIHIEDICQTYRRFDLALFFSIGLFLFGLFYVGIIYLLSFLANRSPGNLISFFKISWFYSIFSTLLILSGQTLLSIVIFFYLTVILTESYYPKIITLTIVAAIITFYKLLKVFFIHVESQTQENAATLLTPKMSPLLWKLVNEVAQILQTAPPNNILIGASTEFYVTEFPVRFSDGMTSGRTLFLSLPLLKKLSHIDLKSIIGHELGHFKGEDTKLTLKFYPMLFKSNRTLELLAEAGWVGRPALYSMELFKFLFEQVVMENSRRRELLADAAGAKVTSPKQMSESLVRYVYYADLHEKAIALHLKDSISLDESFIKIENDYENNLIFWSQLKDIRQIHPFDSHPPLSHRLKHLGESGIDFKNNLKVKDNETANWLIQLDEKSNISITSEENQRLQHLKETQQVQIAESNSEDGKKILDKHFPQILIEVSRKKILFSTIIIGFGIIGIPTIFLFIVTPIWGKILIVLTMLLATWGLNIYWNTWANQYFTITSEYIQFSYWNRPLKYDEIKDIHVMEINSSQTLQLILKVKQNPISKNPIFKMNRNVITLSLNNFNVEPQDLVSYILKYKNRVIDI